MSGVICMQAGVTAQPCPAQLSSHNQWPFCLRWWMREKCSVSTLVVHTVSMLPPSLSLSCCLCFLFFLSDICWYPEGQQLTVLSAPAACSFVPVCSSSSFRCPPSTALTASRSPCYHWWSSHSLSMWLMLGLVAVALSFGGCMCVLSPGQSGEWDPRL